jgi:uncharacterized protein DUF748
MRRRWLVIVGAIALVVVLLALSVQFANEPLRRRVEAQMNAALDGYKVSIRELHVHPVGLSVDLVDWIVTQEAHPKPPIAYVPRLHASVQWLELVRGHLVADFHFERPEFYVDARHAEKEAQNPKPLDQRGWQDAALAIFPLKVNLLRIDGGKFTYLEPGPLGLVYLWNIDFRASNIRNVHSRDREYPSQIHLTANVLESAKLRLDGHADFLAEPHAGINAALDVSGVELARLQPILEHYDVRARDGTLSMTGEIEYAPKVKKIQLARVLLDRPDVEYVKRRGGQPSAGEKAAETAAKVTTQPEVLVRADDVRLDRARLAYANETTDPPYRLFVSECAVHLRDFANVRTGDGDGLGTADVAGKFMDSGPTTAHADFRPKPNGTDFDVNLQIENTDVTTMNDLWRAYGKFDFERGSFSIYSQLTVTNGYVDGYVKPIFVGLDVDAGKEAGIGKKIYAGIVGGVTTILRNQPRDQVATETKLSGPLDNPQTSTLEVLGKLMQNAFFKAILPGLERYQR